MTERKALGGINRRQLLGAGAAVALAPIGRLAAQQRDQPILVVVELSGGNDGLNTIVPHGDDAYYRLRPRIGLPKSELLPIDDHFGFNPGALGLKRLWDDGDLAIVHGCGYAPPSYSHFTSMAYWHTGVPNGGAKSGWVGRLADAMLAPGSANALVNIGTEQSLAVSSRQHTPVVFDDPERFGRQGFRSELAFLADNTSQVVAEGAGNRAFLNAIASSAQQASGEIRDAWRSYRTPIDYGIAPMDLPKVAACIQHGLPARLYYVSFRNNAFDTHVRQTALHRRLLSYAADGIYGFVSDMRRLGLGRKVCVLVFSEFGRRVAENDNLGTDHGSANVMFVAGQGVAGGHFGTAPDLTELNAEDNLIHTVDFRQVYASVIDGWSAPGKSQQVLGERFPPFDLFA